MMVYSVLKQTSMLALLCIVVFSQTAFGMCEEDTDKHTPSKRIILCLDELRDCFNEYKFNYELIDEKKAIGRQLKILPEKLQNYDSLPIVSVQEFYELYDNIEYINSGGVGAVFSAIIKQDRPGLRAGSKIALKIQSDSPSDTLPAYFLTEKVNTVTPFYPKLFGAYRSPITEGFIKKYGNVTINDKKLNFVIEMEFVDSTFTQQFNDPLNILQPIAKIIPDSVIFETFIGSWALPFYEKGQIGDWTVSNLGLQFNIDYYRCYRINDKFYLIESSIMPVRIDIDDFYVGKTIEHNFWINEGRASGHCGNSFLIDYGESTKDPISSMELLEKHFGIFKRDKEYVEEISLSNNVRYFDIKF